MAVEVRAMTSEDLPAVAAIYTAHRGEALQSASAEHVRELIADGAVALVAMHRRRVVGYVTGEVRGWAFGTSPSGWIVGIGVDPTHEGRGVATALLRGAAQRFRALGVTTLRTLVKREDVPILRLFRSAGFVAGPYTELEHSLGDG